MHIINATDIFIYSTVSVF